MPFVLISTLHVSYLRELSCTNAVIGLLPSVFLTVFSIAALCSSTLPQSGRTVRWMLYCYMLGPGMMISTGITGAWLADSSRGWQIGVYFVHVCIWAACLGAAEPHFTSFALSCADSKTRGRFFGGQWAALGFGGVVGSLIWSHLFGNSHGRNVYYASFIIGGLLQMVGIVPLFRFVATPRKANETPEITGNLPRIGPLLRQRPFRGLLAVFLAFGVAQKACSFLALGIVSGSSQDSHLLAALNVAFMVGDVLWAFVSGWVCDAHGARRGLALSCAVFCAGLLATCLVMSAGTSAGWGIASWVSIGAYLLASVSQPAQNICLVNWVAEWDYGVSIPQVFGVLGLLLLPVHLVVPVLMGWQIDKVGFIPIFGLCGVILMAVAAFCVSPWWSGRDASQEKHNGQRA